SRARDTIRETRSERCASAATTEAHSLRAEPATAGGRALSASRCTSALAAVRDRTYPSGGPPLACTNSTLLTEVRLHSSTSVRAVRVASVVVRVVVRTGD